MRTCLVFGVVLVALSSLAFADDDPMATRYGNTIIAMDRDGTVTRFSLSPDHSFIAARGDWQRKGTWSLQDRRLCLVDPIAQAVQRQCLSFEPHAVGDVWIDDGLHYTLVQGMAMSDTPEVLAALAAASRVGNTIVAKDPDGTETRLYWRPDHTFAATRPGWKTEGTWAVKGSSLILHYNIARPNMGSDEEMKNATPRKVGEVWGMADRKVTLVAGEQLAQPK